MAEDRTKANFDIDSQLWDRFKKVSKINESSAAQELRKFIKRYVGENAQLDMKIWLKIQSQNLHQDNRQWSQVILWCDF